MVRLWKKETLYLAVEVQAGKTLWKLVWGCISYVSFAVLNTDQSSLKEEEFIWGYGSEGLKLVMAGRQVQVMEQEQKLST